MGEYYIGQIIMVGFDFAPKGWALCDGQLLPISQNQALFTLIGTQYGGNGQTTFGLPDLRGRVPVGAGHGNGLTPYEVGQTGGQEQVTLTQNEMPQHTHGSSMSSISVTPVYSKNNGARSVPNEGDVPAVVSTGSGPSASTANAYGSNTNTENGASLNANGNVSIAPTGGSMPHENRQPYQVINWIIALHGIFPQRP